MPAALKGDGADERRCQAFRMEGGREREREGSTDIIFFTYVGSRNRRGLNGCVREVSVCYR